jgi:GNAT superfamily N-acetyltransferase
MEKTIEMLSLNAWPAFETIRYGEWILRFADGYTKRANSVTTLGGVQSDLPEKIAFCEKAYRERGLTPIFRLPSFIKPELLDQTLEKKGYSKIDPTFVMRKARQITPMNEGRLTEHALSIWLRIYRELKGSEFKNERNHQTILSSITSETIFASLKKNSHVVACGIGVLENKCLGIFDVVTKQEHRRKGYATELIKGIMAWASDKGANTTYLQVVQDNAPAVHLYTKLGFTVLYEYWYRMLQP